MSEFFYSIAADKSVAIFDGVNSEPFVIQPTWPDGAAWGVGEAEAWAEQMILSLTDETSDLPGDSADAPTKVRPIPEEVVEPEETESPE
jgi:hypothetical protein